MVEFTLPWPPTVNHYWTRTKRGMRLTDKARAYKKTASYYLKAIGLDGDISVTICCNPPDKRKRDIDNILKPLLDVMTENGVYKDDSQINFLLIYKTDTVEKGTVLITVEMDDAKG